jgi:hypothetical protein
MIQENISVTVWRDHGDGHPDGVIICGVYGPVGPEDIAEIQEMMNAPDTKIDMPAEPLSGLVGIVCDVWYDFDSDVSGWTYEEKRVIIDDDETGGDTVYQDVTYDGEAFGDTTYPDVASYEAAATKEYLREMRKIDVDTMFVSGNIDAHVIELEHGLDMTSHVYRGIKYLIHRDVFHDREKWVATERISGGTVPFGVRFPDPIRASAAFRDMVDEKGVLSTCHAIMSAVPRVEAAKMISIDEYNNLRKEKK